MIRLADVGRNALEYLCVLSMGAESRLTLNALNNQDFPMSRSIIYDAVVKLVNYRIETHL